MKTIHNNTTQNIQVHPTPNTTLQQSTSFQMTVRNIAKAGRAVLMIILILLSIRSAPAQEVCNREASSLVVNEVWPAGVVCVRTNIVISNLTILPGVTVLMTGNFSIRVLGIIRAVGTPFSPIVFRASTDNSNGWQGFYFENTVPGSEFDYCRIEGAKNSALQLVRSTPLVRNTIFTNCSGNNGGGVYAILDGRSLIISNCVFAANEAVNDGGAIWCNNTTGRLDVISCTFDRNVANPSYQKRNTAGGAICLNGNGSIRQSYFLTNECRAYTIYAASGVYARGGAIYSSGADFEVAGCKFLGNRVRMTAHGQTPDWSYAHGGSIYLASGNVSLCNSLFAHGNLSAQRQNQLRGSAVYLGQGNLCITNCTFADNQSAAAIHNQSGNLSINSSVLYFNNDSITQITGVATVSYSDVQGSYTGLGNIDFNPVFDGEYNVLPGSPAIDAGDDSSFLNDVSFPPSQGTARNDIGFLGGPLSILWKQSPYIYPNVFRVELGQVVFWEDQANTYLEHSASMTGPWYRYAGATVTVNGKRAVLIELNEPRKFFRLVRVP